MKRRSLFTSVLVVLLCVAAYLFTQDYICRRDIKLIDAIIQTDARFRDIRIDRTGLQLTLIGRVASTNDLSDLYMAVNRVKRGRVATFVTVEQAPK
jgi:hypothetical protein